MAHIVEISNPFNPKDTRKMVHPGGVSIRVFLGELYGPLFQDFFRPTICTVNGKPLMREEWGRYKIKPKDVVVFRSFPGYTAIPYIVYWIIAIVTVASVVIALSQSVPKPGLNGSTPEPDPVYDLKGQRNQIRLGNPIEVPYGRCRLWPSYAARPYNKYIDNDQYQYQLFCLGQGTFDIEKTQIEDTLIANFQDVEIEIYEPGDEVTLFPDNVQTSTEVGGIELFGPNQAEFTGPAGPFTANDAGTQTTKLEVDVSLPAGLYLADKPSGVLSTQYLAVDFQYREIDDAGVPVGGGDWLTLEFFERELATNTPQRYTLEKEVPPGRYEVQATRANNKNLDTKAGNVASWESLRSFMPSTKDYGNVTLIAMKARATNNLNDRAANRFNVVATRKLRTRVSGSWTAPVATRSICWAFADNFQALYGGRLADAFLDLDELEALDALFTTAGWNFDWVFDQRSTVWDQAKIIARCGRSVPMLVGSQVTMIRDYAKTVPTAFFNQDNIVEGSFRWEIKLANIDEFDGLEVEYTDPNTFLPETVECLVDGEAGDNLEQIKFPGCTSRDHAFREGMYMRASKLKLVENIIFQTGLEGNIPSYGDLIQVVHDLPKWGQGGRVLVIAVDNVTLTLSEPVTFDVGVHKIGFRKKDGSTAGPFTVTAGSVSNEVVLAAPIDPTDYFFDNLHELPLFLFGVENLNGTLCTCVGLTPAENDTVEVKAVVYDSAVFAADGDSAPDLPPARVPDPPPDIPVLNCLSLRQQLDPIDENKTRLMWQPAYGATSYQVQRSADGITWVVAGVTSANFLDIATTPGEILHLRVQPVNKGGGAWCAMADPGPVPPPGGSYYGDLFPLPTPVLSFECRTRTAFVCTGTPMGPLPAYNGGPPELNGSCSAVLSEINWSMTYSAAGPGTVAGTTAITVACSAVLTPGGDITYLSRLRLFNGSVSQQIGNGETKDVVWGDQSAVFEILVGIGNPYGCQADICIPGENPWSAWAACDPDEPASLDGNDKVEKQVRIAATNLFPDWPDYRISVPFIKTPIGGGASTTTIAEYQATADGAGEFEFDIDLPTEDGFNTTVGEISVANQ